MLRTFLLLLFFTLTLFSCTQEYTSCQKKALDSKAFLDLEQLSIAIRENERLIYTSKLPSFEIKKWDPFLGLAVIDDRSRFAYPFVFTTKKNSELVAIDTRSSVTGRLISEQCGLDTLASFSKSIQTPALISDNCCALAGVATSKGVIDPQYLKHFLDFPSYEMAYGDIGIRLDANKKSVYVSRVDPFFEKQRFQRNDIILNFDRKKVHSLCDLRRWILFSKIGSEHTIVLLRQGKRYHVKVKVGRRLGGGLLSDTFLERFGLTLDTKLCISSLNSKSAEMELDVGDCLIQVNFHDVKSAQEIQQWVQKSDIDNALLFERRDFQFFIHINGKNGRITKKND